MGCHPPGCRRTLSSLLWRPTGAFGTVQRPKFVPTKNAGPTRSLIVVVVDAVPVESVVVMVVVFVRLDVTVRIAIPWFPCPSLPQQRESKRYGATLIQLQGTASDRQTRTQPQASHRQTSKHSTTKAGAKLFSPSAVYVPGVAWFLRWTKPPLEQ
jgi:hypothetical protein